jgi:hypothetical protein
MFKIEISDETADSMFRDILKQDYLGLKRDIKNLKERGDLLPEFERKDLEFNQRIADAMEIVMEYYFVESTMLKIIQSTNE